MSFDIVVNEREVLEAIDKLEPKASNKTVAAATSEAAKYLKPRVKAGAPRGKTGRLAKAVYRGRAKRDRPGAFVAIRGGKKGAFYRHMVVGGTKAHTTAKRGGGGGLQPFAVGGDTIFSTSYSVSGAPAQPFVSQTADRYGAAALDHSIRKLADDLDL